MSRWRAALVLIVLFAAAVRLIRLGEVPPGIHADAAGNLFSARCLATAGCDASGKPWPILYTEGFGENRSTLFLYVLLPFVATSSTLPNLALGVGPKAAALPSAIAGILAVLLVAWIGAAFFDKATGLAAAFVLATAPWALMLSRTGHEAGIVPLLVAAPIAAMVWAGLPLAEGREPSATRAVLAGIVFGLACYGYPAVRLFLPAFLVIAVAFHLRGWIAFLRTPRGGAALVAFAVSAVATAGPLYLAHLTQPEINRRAETALTWSHGDDLATAAAKVAARYALHFTPDFFFVHGDGYFWNAIPDAPPLRLWNAPFLLMGLAAALWTTRSSVSSRAVLALVAAYPAGDVLTRHMTVHAWRASPGLVGVVLVAGLGASTAYRWIAARSQRLATSATIAALVIIATSDLPFLHYYFVEMPRRDDVRRAYNVDLLEACARVGPKLDAADAVFFTVKNPGAVGNTWAVAAVGLGVDPRRWFAEDRRFANISGARVCTRFGKVHFIVDDSWKEDYHALIANGRPDRVIFVLRPSETAPGPVTSVVADANGEPALLIYQLTK